MREIKFRGKRHNGEWVYGSLVYYNNIDTAIHYEIDEVRRFDWCYVDPDTVGQFTGLTDKNGKEIYEGDIVHLDTWAKDAMQIVFLEAAFCLADKRGEYIGDIHYVQHGGVNQCTILGNIHDNPDLLKD